MYIYFVSPLVNLVSCVALSGLLCDDVPSRHYSITYGYFLDCLLKSFMMKLQLLELTRILHTLLYIVYRI